MIAKAKCSYMRSSSRKVGQVIDLIRGKDVPSALAILGTLTKGNRGMITKVLKSAITSARQKGLNESQLFISKITSDQGPSWKRFRAASFGRATPILKRTSHLNIELDVLT